MGNFVWKILGGGAGLAAGKVASAASDKGWRAVTGREPKKPTDSGASIAEAAIFAAVSAGVVVALQMFFEQKAADYYARNAGHLPQEIRERSEG